jgi:hypothetical protein
VLDRPAKPSAARVGNLLLNKKTTYKNLCTAKNLSEIEQEIVALIGAAVKEEEEEYLAGPVNFRKEMLEAYELYELVREGMDPETVLVDVGCSHGLSSFLISCYLKRSAAARNLMWIDANTECKAAEFAERLQVPFYDQVKGHLPEQAMVLIVNVCGNALLEILEQCKNLKLCVVPCCGPEGVSYEDWLLKISNTIGKPTQFVQLENNLKRTAVISL